MNSYFRNIRLNYKVNELRAKYRGQYSLNGVKDNYAKYVSYN